MSETVLKHVEFSCPYCGEPCTAFMLDSGDGVMHREPACAAFLGMAPDRFLWAARHAEQLRN